MTISFDATSLLGWYTSREGMGAAGASATGSGSSSSSAAPAPTPPWGLTSSAAKPTTLATAVQNGSPFIDLSSAKLDIQGATPAANTDYKSLFALYQGVTALEQLAEQASSTTVGATQLTDLNSTFESGLQQVQSFLAGSPFKEFTVAQGAVETDAQSTVARPSETDTYQTGTIFTGQLSAPVPSLSGDVKFSATVTKASNKTQVVNFDLSEMGSTVRTLPNVVQYLNSKLSAAGLTTRFSDVRIPAVAQTTTSGGQTYTTPAGADSFALKITGTTAEALSFSAPSSAPAVYVLQSSGTATSSTALTATGLTTVPPDATQQFLKLSTSTATPGVTTVSQAFSQTLAAQTQSPQTSGALASATGPDGSIYVVTSDTGHAPDGETLQGAQDVVLTKYDSTGKAVYTRTLGAAGSATGYSVAVSADGKSVAVASAVTGNLDANDSSITPGQADTVVSTYNAQTGDENWTTRSGSSNGDDHPTGVAFGADGSVYVAGETSGRFNGQVQTGTQDAFVQSLSSTGVLKGTQQFGAAGLTSSSNIVVSGNQVFLATTENGHAVLHRFDVAVSGALQSGLSRDLGSLDGGNVAGVAIDADGSVVVAGSTHNGALAAGTTTNAYTGGREAFVARLASNGVAEASDQLTYLSSGGDATATSVSIAGGEVYLAGQVTGAATAASNGLPTHEGYVTAVDPSTGAVAWTQKLNGADGQDAPASVSATATGASPLDALGLPQGQISYVPSTNLVDLSALRPGDNFSIATGGGASIKVSIDAGETMDTLASKIQLASGFNVTASVIYSSSGYELNIKPVNDRTQVTLTAGATGQDALAPLGLTAGLITSTADSSATISKTSDIKSKPYALGLSTNLNLTSASAIKTAQAQLLAAQSVLKSIYTDMTTAPSTSTTSGAAVSGTVPAYITAQIANYQAGLAKLTGSG